MKRKGRPGLNVIDRYVRSLRSPCNTCDKMLSFPEHCCKEYNEEDGIPPDIYSGWQTTCEGYIEKKEIKEDKEGKTE